MGICPARVGTNVPNIHGFLSNVYLKQFTIINAPNGMSLAMAQVLETNTATFQNLRKKGFEVFNQYSVYEHTLPLREINDSRLPPISV